MSAEQSAFDPESEGNFSAKNDTVEVLFFAGNHADLEWGETLSSDQRACRVMGLMGIQGFYQPVLPLQVPHDATKPL